MALLRGTRLLAIALGATGTAADAQAPRPAIDSATCMRCHAQPSRRFHADLTHKKFDCVVGHTEAKSHLGDSKVKPKLTRDDALCASCHALKPRR